MYTQGLVNGIIGPSLMELQSITSTTTTKVALLFTWNGIGRIPGSLFTAFMFGKFSPNLLLGVAVVLLAITTTLLPWCQDYIMMSSVMVMQGWGVGSLGSGEIFIFLIYLLNDHTYVYPYYPSNT